MSTAAATVRPIVTTTFRLYADQLKGLQLTAVARRVKGRADHSAVLRELLDGKIVVSDVALPISGPKVETKPVKAKPVKKPMKAKNGKSAKSVKAHSKNGEPTKAKAKPVARRTAGARHG
jgi:hypothetical protein